MVDSALLHPSAFVLALLAPLLVWGAMVFAATLGGYPGVLCMTPMAWLLALMAGNIYVSRSQGRPGRRPALAAALLGASLGLGLGLIFVVVSAFTLPPPPDAEEAARTVGFNVFMVVASVVVCPLLSLFTTTMRLRRAARRQ
jgi:hypothetical protein